LLHLIVGLDVSKQNMSSSDPVFVLLWYIKRTKQRHLYGIHIQTLSIKRRMMSSGMLRRVAHVRTDVSEEHGASFIRVTRIGGLGTTLAATSNRRTLRRNISSQRTSLRVYALSPSIPYRSETECDICSSALRMPINIYLAEESNVTSCSFDRHGAALRFRWALNKKTNSVALSPQANYTDWATATCQRNLVPTFVDRGMSRGQRGGSPTVVNLSFLDRSRYFSFK
jgi:hypothetical protein